MPVWGDIAAEIQAEIKAGNHAALDVVRRKYLAAAKAHTGRDTILYATKWTQAGASNLSPDLTSINDEDLQGLMEVVYGLEGPDLDLVIHSPGGSIEAAESIVAYLRSKFPNIRVIVPSLAMSAATMIACSADQIVLGKHSFLGPTDPQLILPTQLGVRMIPAQAILDQFSLAQNECANPAKLASWLPMLGQYGPDLLVRCQNVLKLAEELVRRWLEQYMFAGEANAQQKAHEIAEKLCRHADHKSHARHIGRSDLEAMGLKIARLEDDQAAQDIFLSLFHATTLTFDISGAAKIIENHIGRAFIKTAQVVALQAQPAPAPPTK